MRGYAAHWRSGVAGIRTTTAATCTCTSITTSTGTSTGTCVPTITFTSTRIPVLGDSEMIGNDVVQDGCTPFRLFDNLG